MGNTYVKDSTIHGMGLFATKRIKAGKVIGRYTGSPTQTDGPYVLWLTESQGIEVTDEFRFINHSDKPNVAYYNDGTIVALADISPSEELTHNYGGDDG